MGKLLVASLVAALLAAQVRGGNADELTLTSGKLSKDAFGFVNQKLSVKNNTAADIEVVYFECGFERDHQLLATGIGNLQNLKRGETGEITVAARLINTPDHSDCHAFGRRGEPAARPHQQGSKVGYGS
jgi:hypothetical protein